jgi:hypothetical protein
VVLQDEHDVALGGVGEAGFDAFCGVLNPLLARDLRAALA